MAPGEKPPINVVIIKSAAYTADMAKIGKPPGTTKAVMAARRAAGPEAEFVVRQQTAQERIASRQRKDLKKLQKAIESAGDQGRTLDPNEAGHLARATKTLHELEARAYGFNEQSNAVKAIILIPAAPKTMGEWSALSQGIFGTGHLPPASPGRRLIAPEPFRGGEDSEPEDG